MARSGRSSRLKAWSGRRRRFRCTDTRHYVGLTGLHRAEHAVFGGPLLRQLHLAINETLARIKTDAPEASGMVGGVNEGRQGCLMPRRLSTTSGVRQRVIDTMQASWDRWRIEGRMCELERALNAGESVVLSAK